MVALQHFLDLAIEPLDHSVCLGMLGWGQTVLDAEVGAEQVELVRPASAHAEEAVGELLAIVSENGAEADVVSSALPPVVHRSQIRHWLETHFTSRK